VRDAPMTALGGGVMDVPAVVRAARGRAEWLIVELDRCATDMFTAVEESFRYLSTLARQ
jgi:sugar phosphate isomerase/epimerase